MITMLSTIRGCLLPRLTRSLSKVTYNDFLTTHAKFPFPTTTGTQTESRSVFTSDVSIHDIALLENKWKATHAIRDPDLFKKLCNTLPAVLGTKLLDDVQQEHLLAVFSPKIELIKTTGQQNPLWEQNENELSSDLLSAGVFKAALECLATYDRHRFRAIPEHMMEDSLTRVDYLIQVDDIPRVLVEVKSPSVIQNIGKKLPPQGIELSWLAGASLQVRILTKAAEYLGRRKLQWLFITSHNEWIACRLVKCDGHCPFLVYSDMVTMQDSSIPFQAFLAAILSVVHHINVEPNIFDPAIELNIVEKGKHGSKTRDSARITGSSENAESDSDIMLAKDFPNLPPDSDVYTWVHVHSLDSDKTLALPQCARNSERRLWMTNDEVFVMKIFDTNRSDADIREHFLHEFRIYRLLEEAHRPGKCDRIAPRCYGAFEDVGIAILILEACSHNLKEWDELSTLEQFQVYELVKRLHSIGLVHGDLEPRNVVRDDQGGFRLIDFSVSCEHTCEERKVGKLHTPHPAQNETCLELLTLRSELRKLHLLPHSSMDKFAF